MSENWNTNTMGPDCDWCGECDWCQPPHPAEPERSIARVLDACDEAESHARHVVDDEVFVSVGLVRNAVNGVD